MTDRTILYGSPALSDFRLGALNAQLAGAQVTASAWLYLVDGTADDRVSALLGDVRATPEAAGTPIYVLPRLGTVSPWSSKATDIARVCELTVTRLERGRVLWVDGDLSAADRALIHDRMTESLLADVSTLGEERSTPRPLVTIPLAPDAAAALRGADAELGLALSDDEIEYLADYYTQSGRAPTDAELMMFAQINSEHCRHKIFNADFTVDGEPKALTLFDNIRESYKSSPGGVLSAYKDNAAVLKAAAPTTQLWPVGGEVWGVTEEPAHICIKVETHNHPTAISPEPGAATGAGGEIRDEAATGRGGRTKAGLAGFSVSNLRIPGALQPWEAADADWHGKPGHMASALQIMLEGPIGSASFSNEFGRPNLTGYFRTYEDTVDVGLGQRNHGYHKPIMIAGGLGNVRPGLVEKLAVPVDAKLIVLGGPAMLIGLGGGAASSIGAGEGDVALDFASVQRANPEMERRAQEVIDRCTNLGEDNPILSIHDVGAGGISNALPEIIDEDGRGGVIRLADVHSADPAMSPMEIWSNESQERYVLALLPDDVPRFEDVCKRERCPYAVVGEATAKPQLIVRAATGEHAVDMPMQTLLGKTPKMHRDVQREAATGDGWTTEGIDLADAAERVLRLPSVASKQFLITIGDRSITGCVAGEQMIGPWQVPVGNVAVTCGGFAGFAGEAMAMGERTPVAILDGPASGRMAVGEAITNLLSADIDSLDAVRLSANWMAACGQPGEDAKLYDTVQAVGAELAPALGIAIPVGKDSLSMRTAWKDDAGNALTQTAPLSLIVTAFAGTPDVRRTVTPQLVRDESTALLLIDFAGEQNRLGGSALAQVYNRVGRTPPDLDDAAQFKASINALITQKKAGKLLAYHDRSDGGLFTTLLEMAFAGRCGLDITLPDGDTAAWLFAEELGCVVQVSAADAGPVAAAFTGAGASVRELGRVRRDGEIVFKQMAKPVLTGTRAKWQQAWAETSWRLQRLRDNPAGADSEFAEILGDDDPGLNAQLSFDTQDDVAAPYVHLAKPKVAILREQGVNSAREMAWAFHRGGFEAVDVHMSDMIDRGHRLDDYVGLVAPGGFSYGDTLGAGRGWAATIQFNARLADHFRNFFARDDRFALGICNGCQMLASLKELIPGAEAWPKFVRNASEQFEGRTSLVRVPNDTNSVLLAGMAGSMMPVAVAHGEGRAQFAADADLTGLSAAQQLALRYVDNHGAPTEAYPANPNGSPAGVAGVTNADGRVTLMMPHPERVVRCVTNSWADPAWSADGNDDGPWLRMFRNARVWVG